MPVMPKKYFLSNAVNEIRLAIDEEKEFNNGGFNSPFFFIIGAGVSVPHIPLAGEIERKCRNKLRTYNISDDLSPEEKTSPMKRYVRWFEKAFPQPEHRRAFLHQLIHEKPISRATFRLAHLLCSGNLTKIIITPNFDEMLERALRLFGSHVITCDHPKMALRIDPTLTEAIQIVHVHGTHWFYDCRNLEGEMEKVANPGDRNDVCSMPDLLWRILYKKSPLVVGYSGWENDVIMTALKTRLQYDMKFNIYWFCFLSTEADNLPHWLVSHPNVRVIVPYPTPSQMNTEDNSQSFIKESNKLIETRLPATNVFEEMIREFKVEDLELTKDPLWFFADQLDKNFVAKSDSIDDGENGDIYLLSKVIQTVRNGARLEKEDREKNVQNKEFTKNLESIRNAIRSSEYKKAVEEAKKIYADILPDQREELESSLEQINSSVELNPEIVRDACDVRIHVAEKLLASNNESDEWSLRLANALYYRGRALYDLGKNTEAIDSFKEIIHRFKATGLDSMKNRIGKSMVDCAWILVKDGEFEEAITILDELDKIKKIPTTLKAEAFICRGVIWGEKKELNKALTEFTNVIDRIPDTPAEQIALALINRSIVYRQNNDFTTALSDLTRVIDHVLSAPAKLVAQALIYRGAIFEEKNNDNDALADYTKVIEQLPGAPAKQVAQALICRGAIFEEINNDENALADYTKVIERLPGATEDIITRAYVRRGSIYKKKGNIAKFLKETELIAERNLLKQFIARDTTSTYFEWYGPV